MKPILAGGMIIALLTFSAHAADLAAAPPPLAPVPASAIPPLVMIYDWTGFYLGINGGGVWGQSNQSEFGAPNFNISNFNLSGVQIGGTVGFNLQIDHAVFGLEGDLDWGRIGASGACPFAVFVCATNSDYLGTARARAGYAAGRVMVYATGGAAFGDVRQSFSPGIGTNEGTISNRVGWALGGGAQFAIWDHWSAKLEYLHVDLGTFVCGIACSGFAVQSVHATLTEEVIRAGINYRF